MRHWIVSVVTLWCVSTLPLAGQGRTDYLNVESPQVHPIEVAEVGGHEFVLIANTPDNSVEIWDTDESLSLANRFRTRVRVGLEPVTVRYHAAQGRFYTANFLGDSISVVELTAPAGAGSLATRLITTTAVGDEPLDIAFHDEDPFGQSVDTLFVTHMTLDGVSWLKADDLSTLVPVSPATVQKGDVDNDGVDDQIALKEPRAVSVRCDKVFILATKGGNESASAATDPTFFDYGMLITDLNDISIRQDLGQLGSSNFNMAFSDDGDLFVVGGDALNETLLTEAVVADAPTGFVKSMVYMIDDACNNPQIKARDVNLVLQVGGNPGLPQHVEFVPVAKNKALAQLKDIVVFDWPGQPRKVFFTAFGSDRVGVLEPNFATNPNHWPRRSINIVRAGALFVSKAGPRGIALKRGTFGLASDPPRLYVLNRLENSFSVLDPVSETRLGQVTLQHDPRPRYLLEGQRFLYDARLSDNGFSSCASCHPDARTDGLAWDLGTAGSGTTPITPEELKDFAGISPTDDWPDDKKFMVTQSMQGLLNFELDPGAQHLTTNKPYYWRGTREDFKAFNPAFVSLLKRGFELSPDQIDQFEEYINSVHFPPNVKQPDTRILSGTFGDPDTFTDPLDPTEPEGSGALAGLKIYHMADSDGRSCAHCHALPEGSNNRLTEDLPTGLSPFDKEGPELDEQPIETAALRGVFQREARRDKDGTKMPKNSPITGLEGLTHTGFGADTVNDPASQFNEVASINAFNRRFFEGRDDFCDPPGAPPLIEFCGKLQAVNQFVHEMDWGVAPLVGFTFTVDERANSSSPNFDPVFLSQADAAIDKMESQARLANAGIAVQVWSGVTERGFWYDPLDVSQEYVEEPAGSTLLRPGIYGLMLSATDRAVFIATPLGSERRVAAPTGIPSDLSGPNDPESIELMPMIPNTAYVDIPRMTKFWGLLEDEMDPSKGYIETHGGLFAHTVRLYQHGLIAATDDLGIDEIRHDAPRRWRIKARNVLPGAILHLFVDDGSDSNPPDDTQPVTETGMTSIAIPIYPTGPLLGDGRRIWETAVEFEPLVYYQLMLGGQAAPGVSDAFSDVTFTIEEPPQPGQITFNPDDWNWVWARIVNPDGRQGDSEWQPITLEPPPP